ncbi:tyrosine-type recombinase/integrase [Ancylobacter sp.]|uniref:tyrosine-type recombinase/integrase n=1 Tax=Ancylobacter sp. TaxID=1872567 RepID=UPI003D104E53
MSGRKPKPPRLHLRERDGRSSIWVVLDRGREVSTGCSEEDARGAEDRFKEYLAGKHVSTVGTRDFTQLSVADVLTFYASAKRPSEGAAEKTIRRYNEMVAFTETLNEWWGAKFVSDIRGETCRHYVDWRTSQPLRRAKSAAALKKRVSTATARRELEVLRAAVNLYHAEFTLPSVPKITLPEKSVPRDRWLTRSEVAVLLWACLGWRRDASTGRWSKIQTEGIRKQTRTRRAHISRFILLGLYTGTRHEAIERLQWHANVDGGWIEIERGLIYRRGTGERETKKRRPPARIPHRLLPHLERWLQIDLANQTADGKPIRHVIHTSTGEGLSTPIRTGWEGIRSDAGLGDDVVPHVLRHTCVTWQLQAGVLPWEVAGAVGMTVEQIENGYGHHSPDYQKASASAFSRGGKA